MLETRQSRMRRAEPRQYRLTAVFVRQVNKPGRYHDGAGLYLQVRSAQEKSWLFRYHRNKPRWMGLGRLRDVSLTEARTAAAKCRKQLLAGIDPLETRQVVRRQALLETAARVTFKDATDRFIASHQVAWRNVKHHSQWRNTLSTYAYPVFGHIAVGAIDTGLIVKALEPFWISKPETASRLRGRIERVLDWAKARGYRQGENPARWRGHLDHLLPARRKVRAVRHHAALPYTEIPGFMGELRAREGVSARALEFTVLTACRTGEAIGARWDEIDLAAKVWTVPADRMKADKEYTVPLSQRAVEILTELLRDTSGFLFPGAKEGKPISNMAMLELLRGMKGKGFTVHGFRSSFRDWAGDCTNFSREIIEHALAHKIKDKAEASYRRSDALEKRRQLMVTWCAYCCSAVAASGVVALQTAP